MPLLADFLKDNQDTTWKIYPSPDGELMLTEDMGYEEEGWEDPSYTIPGQAQMTYQTLADSSGGTWYMYPTPEQELILTQLQPPSLGGVWADYVYVGADKQAPTEAATGDEIYLSFADVNGTDWYVYPNAQGELVITNAEPD